MKQIKSTYTRSKKNTLKIKNARIKLTHLHGVDLAQFLWVPVI